MIEGIAAILDHDRRSLEEIAEAAGVTRISIWKWRTRNNAHLANFEAVLNACGYRLAIVRRP